MIYLSGIYKMSIVLETYFVNIEIVTVWEFVIIVIGIPGLQYRVNITNQMALDWNRCK